MPFHCSMIRCRIAGSAAAQVSILVKVGGPDCSGGFSATPLVGSSAMVGSAEAKSRAAAISNVGFGVLMIGGQSNAHATRKNAGDPPPQRRGARTSLSVDRLAQLFRWIDR